MTVCVSYREERGISEVNTCQDGKGPLLKYEGKMGERRIGGTDRESYVRSSEPRERQETIPFSNVFKAVLHGFYLFSSSFLQKFFIFHDIGLMLLNDRLS